MPGPDRRWPRFFAVAPAGAGTDRRSGAAPARDAVPRLHRTSENPDFCRSRHQCLPLPEMLQVLLPFQGVRAPAPDLEDQVGRGEDLSAFLRNLCTLLLVLRIREARLVSRPFLEEDLQARFHVSGDEGGVRATRLSPG